MIKSLFGEEEEKDAPSEDSFVPKETEPAVDVAKEPSDDGNAGVQAAKGEEMPDVRSANDDMGNASETPAVVPFEVERPIGSPTNNPKTDDEAELESRIAAIEAALEGPDLLGAHLKPPVAESVRPVVPAVTPGVPTEQKAEAPSQPPPSATEDADTIAVHHPKYIPDNTAETIRKTGMAYSAAIALFGSVVFMLLIGWLADLLLGIRPWGTVVGIVIGAAIGFMQFFSITSKIISPKKDDFARVSIANTEGDEEASDVTPPEQTGPDS